MWYDKISLKICFLAQSVDTVEIKLVFYLPTPQSSDDTLLTKSVQTLHTKNKIFINILLNRSLLLYICWDVHTCPWFEINHNFIITNVDSATYSYNRTIQAKAFFIILSVTNIQQLQFYLYTNEHPIIHIKKIITSSCSVHFTCKQTYMTFSTSPIFLN